MTESNWPVSVNVRLDVGSSIITIRAFIESVLAISTICCCAIDNSLSFVSGSTSSPSLEI